MGILFKDYCNIENDPQFIRITVNTKEQANERDNFLMWKEVFSVYFLEILAYSKIPHKQCKYYTLQFKNDLTRKTIH